MSEILFLAHRIPFPPDRGDKIRSHHILKRLAEFAPVHVATFADDDGDEAGEAELAALACSHCLVERTKPVPVAGLQALATARPVSLAAFHHEALAAYVRKVLASRPISAIYVFSGQMGQYLPSDYGGRVIVDFVDVDSAKFDAYAAKTKWPMRWVHAREARLLRAEEARLAVRADVGLLISQEEVALFRERLPHSVSATTDIRVLANGIDSAQFDPAIVEPEPAMRACPGPRIIFTGQMDYPPNVDAALRVIERILPEVRRSFPDASFHVVGRNPAERLLRHNGSNGCHVWGRVEDMPRWLRAADLALVPLEIGRGVQNKVLEAMAMALPVVLTAPAATGIAGIDGRDFRIADGDRALADTAIELLREPGTAHAMGQAARNFVVAKASWASALEQLPEIVGLLMGHACHAA